MFESRERLAEDIQGLLEGLRQAASGRYACLLDPEHVLFETPEPDSRDLRALRSLLGQRGAAVFAIPAQLAAQEPIEDVFEGWEGEDLFLAFVNQRVAVVIACREAEPLKQALLRPLRALSDRLLRYQPSWRMDTRGRGFFFGRARLDLVVIGRAEGRADAQETLE